MKTIDPLKDNSVTTSLITTSPLADLSVDEIYLLFNEKLQNIYVKKGGFSQVSIDWHESHNKKLAQLIDKNLNYSVGVDLKNRWLNVFFSSLDKINVVEGNYSYQTSEINSKIEKSFAMYNSHFDTYLMHFLPLKEREMLNLNISAHPSAEGEKNRHKI